MPLSETTVRMAKPRPKAYRLSDGHGLYVEVAPNGSRYWRLKYRFEGKEKRLALGVYPVVTLARAREDALEARRLLHDGVDPSQEEARTRPRGPTRRRQRVRKSRSRMARLHETQMDATPRPKCHRESRTRRFSRARPPAIGEMKAPEFLDAIRRIEKRGAIDIAQRVRQRSGAVFAYAIGVGYADNEPNCGDERQSSSLIGRRRVRCCRPTSCHCFSRSSAISKATKRSASRLKPSCSPWCGLRNCAARGGTKSISRKKPMVDSGGANEDARPTCRAVVASGARHTRRTQALFRSVTIFLFPSLIRIQPKPISENTMLYAIYRMGYHHRATTHGFRALASTILNECGLWRA